MKKNFANISRFLFVWSIAGLCQLPFILYVFNTSNFLFKSQNGVLLFFSLHLFSVFILLFSFPKGSGWLRRDRLWGICFIFTFVLLMPFVGWILSAVTFLGHFFFTSPFLVDDEYLGRIKKSEERKLDANLLYFTSKKDIDKSLSEEVDVAPVVDALTSSDVHQLIGGFEYLVKLNTPEAIRVFNQYKRHVSSDMALFVNSALAKLKKEYVQEVQEVQKRLKRDYSNVALKITLAEKYQNYANSGLLDEHAASLYRKSAIFHLRSIVTTSTKVDSTFCLFISLLIDEKRYDEALDTIGRMEGKADHDYLRKLRQFKVRIYFDERSGIQLGKEVEVLRGSEGLSPQWKEAISWWSS